MKDRNRFDYVLYDKKATQDQQAFKMLFQAIEHGAEERLSPGRAKSIIMTKLEEAYMWVGKAIRDDLIARDDGADSQEERGDS